MPHFLFPVDADFYSNHLQPFLAQGWRERSFAPCRKLCQELLARVHNYHQAYHGLAEKTLVEQVIEGLSFDKAIWRALVGEVLLFAAEELPLLQVPVETLCCLLAPQTLGKETAREQFTPIQQVLFGSKDLVFGGGYYRPDFAGYNEVEDVNRLWKYLEGMDSANWKAAALTPLAELSDEEEREEELAFARQSWQGIMDVYGKAFAKGWLMICEAES
jgi:hypothetical protein